MMKRRASWGGVVCVGISLLAAVLSGGCGGGSPEADSEVQGGSSSALPVKVAAVKECVFVRQVKAQGTLRSKNYAVISSREDGTIETISVDKGDMVSGGKTVLFTIDSLTQRQNLTKAEADLVSLESSVKVAEAELEVSRAKLQKASWDKERYENLFKAGSSTQRELESFRTDYDCALAAHRYSEAYVAAAKARVEQGRAAVAIARKSLDDTTLLAPFDGMLTDRYAEPGEEIKSGERVFMLEDLSLLEMTVSLPSLFYPLVVPGQTKVQLRVGGQPAGEYLVTYRSPTIEEGLRTFEVKAEVPNDGKGLLVAGVLIEAEFILEQHKALGVPSHAVLLRDGGTQILLAGNGQAVRQLVSTGLETDGWQEVQGDGLKAGQLVICEGQYQLSDGKPIRVVE